MNLQGPPRPVREKFTSLTDADVASNPTVTAALERVRQAEAAHAACHLRLVRANDLVGVAKATIGEFDSAIAEIDDDRPQLAAAILAGERPDMDDQAAQTLRAELVRWRDLHVLAAPSIDAVLQAARRQMQYLGPAVGDAEMALEGARDTAKLRLAEQLAS